jgi:hypothetical protein
MVQNPLKIQEKKSFLGIYPLFLGATIFFWLQLVPGTTIEKKL